MSPTLRCWSQAHDVLSQEWPDLLGLASQHRAVLEAEFGHLFDHRFWCGVQEQVATGEPHEVLPYPATARI